MNNKTLAISILSLTAALLLLANLYLPGMATASTAVKDRDYQLVSARIDSGGEALYVIDSRSGQVAILKYDTKMRAVTPVAVRSLTEVFPQASTGTGKTSR